MGRDRRNKLQELAAKRGGGQYVPVPHHVLRSNAWTQLNAYEKALICDLLAQYNGLNNGDLCAAWTLMKKRGWKSKSTLSKAIKECREGGWIEVTRQGGRRKASLYALSFYAIDDCKGKLDVYATLRPSNLWMKSEPPPDLTPTCYPKSPDVRAMHPDLTRQLVRQEMQSASI
jgi:hypothetical protein